MPRVTCHIIGLRVRPSCGHPAPAQLLGDFSALLGGDQHGALLFDLLQSLARIEETMVRAKAVASLSSVFASVDVSSGGAEVGASAVK